VILPAFMGLLAPASGGGAPTDPNFANVVLLLHGEGTNGSTTVVDSSSAGRTMTCHGNAQISTAQFKYGSAALAFDGTGDYITAASSSDFGYGTGAFTIEFWVRFASVGTAVFIDHRNNPAASETRLTLYYASGNLSYFFNGSVIATRAWSPSTGVWYHVAACRDGSGNLRLFTNGSTSGSVSHGAASHSTAGISIGGANDGSASLNGWIDDMRITKGVGLYTANFTPPSAQFPDA
jgi:hypothetical protein